MKLTAIILLLAGSFGLQLLIHKLLSSPWSDGTDFVTATLIAALPIGYLIWRRENEKSLS